MSRKRDTAKNRRGFSIAEAVIAMAIITVVSMAAISLQITALQSGVKLVEKTTTIQYAENALDCFRWAQDAEDFKEAITHLGFAEEVGKFVLAGDMYRSEIEVAGNTFTLAVTDQSGQEIYRITYEK